MKKMAVGVLKIVLSTGFLFSILFYSENVLLWSYSSYPPGCDIYLPSKGRNETKEPTPEQLQSGKGVGCITWSKITGGPELIKGSLTAPSEDDPETIALRFLEEKKVLYGIDDPYQDLYKTRSATNQWTGYTIMHFGQIYKGVPVENSLVISVASNGVISSIYGLYYSDLEVDVNPIVSAEEAKAIALPHELNCDSPFVPPEGVESKSFLFPTPFFPPIDAEFMETIKPELLIWPAASKDYLLWRFRIRWWSFFVDAHDGIIRGAAPTRHIIGAGDGLSSETSEEADTSWPNMEVTPGSLDFGKICIGGNSPVKEVIIANKGDVNLIIANISISESAFALREFSNSFPIAIGPAESLSLRLCFSPTSSGVVEGAMVIDSNDPYYPQFELALQGTGLVKALHILPTESLLYYLFPYYSAFWYNLPYSYENMKNSGLLSQNPNLHWHHALPYYYFDKDSYPPFPFSQVADFFNLPILELQYRNYFYPLLFQTSGNF